MILFPFISSPHKKKNAKICKDYSMHIIARVYSLINEFIQLYFFSSRPNPYIPHVFWHRNKMMIL